MSTTRADLGRVSFRGHRLQAPLARPDRRVAGPVEFARRTLARPKENGEPIDLLIDRGDATINVCEMKLSESELAIDKRLAAELRAKIEVFRRASRTKKTLLLAMTAPYGVHANLHRDELVAATVTKRTSMVIGCAASRARAYSQRRTTRWTSVELRHDPSLESHQSTCCPFTATSTRA